ncbi:MazG nucleotide pyrophosphohydrolase domain-containing protein [Mycolicibacterium wolinskyi]|uniref:8-oxoguanine DNA glycosylase OGG fold protein n=1 Tax=Mycolicibacterium wolinskyi TaxID=59750 RepID=UPI003917681D
MSDGKLVRDLIPDLIRESGRMVEVRQLAGHELAHALVDKLLEEVQEAAEVVNDRNRLIDELADVTEVLSTLLKCHGIEEQEVADAAAAKTRQRGGFGSGTWLVSDVPRAVRQYTTKNVERQRNRWIPERWIEVFSGHEDAHADLTAHVQEAGGIARRFLHAQAARDPVDLFLMTMAWGYQPKDYGPQRTAAVLRRDGAADSIRAIVELTRSEGAAAGWNALLNTHKITGFGMSFGTKLLYYAGYTTAQPPRPLVLDERVRAALAVTAPGTVPAKGLVCQADYLRYLELAEKWAEDPLWKQEPDVVEYALFAHGGKGG